MLPRKHCRFYALGRPFLNRLFGRLDGRTAVSEAARQYVGRYFPADYAIIPNGVDGTTFRPDLEPLPTARGVGPSILFVRRLEERKGFILPLRGSHRSLTLGLMRGSWWRALSVLRARRVRAGSRELGRAEHLVSRSTFAAQSRALLRQRGRLLRPVHRR
jgi:hypothetical protein